MALSDSGVAAAPSGPPLESRMCDVVISDVVQTQGRSRPNSVLHLERFLQEMGPQIYSHRAHKENNAGSWATSLCLASPVAGNDLTVFPDPEQKITRKLEHALTELVTTERTYVKRIEALFNRYAIPLRQLAQDRDTQIIPAMEAERMFGNLGEIVAANKMLLCELEILYEQGAAYMAASVGDVMVQNMHRFACYDEYMGDFEQAKGIYNRMLKNKGFRGFIEVRGFLTQRTQHSADNLGNSGLRELMIEPLQRIPRYQLLMNNIMKEMPTSSVQYQRLHEANGLAGHIASREVNNATRRAAVLWSCSKVIEKFPTELTDSRRELLGCIDVEEPLQEVPSGMLHALGSVLGRKRAPAFALLVFDDMLVIAQRHSHTPTHQLLRVQDPDTLVDKMQAEQIQSPGPGKKYDLTFAGMIDLSHVLATGLNGSQARFAFLAPLRGSANVSMTRVFADAHASAELPRMALFLDCIWKAQAVHRARARALQVRASNVPAQGERPAHAMLWTLLSPSQFQRFPHKRSLLFQIGSVGSAMQLQSAFHIEMCVNIELHPNEEGGTVTILRSDGVQHALPLTLREIPLLCADLCCGTVQLPEAPAPRPPPVEVPVRRAKSLRTPSRRAPGAHRTRSLMSERVRASIQSSLEAVIESQELEAKEDEAAGNKRSVPLGEISNLSPKRRAVSRFAHASAPAPTEEDLVKEYEHMDTEPEPPLAEQPAPAPAPVPAPVPMETTPSRNALTMPAEESKEFPNPFEEIELHGNAMHDPVRMDEAEVEAQLEEVKPEVPGTTERQEGTEKPLPPITELDPMAELAEELGQAKGEASAAPASAAPTSKPTSEPASEPMTETESPARASVAAPASHTPEPDPPLAPPKPVHQPAPQPVAPSPPEPTKRRFSASAPVSRTASGASGQVTEKQMQDLLRPLLGQLHEAPSSQQAVRQEVGELPTPQHAEIEGRDEEMDLTVLRLLQEEQARATDVPPVPALPDRMPDEPETPLLPALPSGLPQDHESVAMKRALVRVNESIAALRQHRPTAAAAASGWQQDWAQFKQAVKAMNRCWNDMERAYENKQMDLAALRLAQFEKPPSAPVSQEEVARLQDEANMLVPLRIQVEQLSQKVESLTALEQDTRMENAELYNVFNEELSHLYKYSFRPANEEIDTLRQALVAAKTELHQVRVENRALRQQCALAQAT